MWATEESGSTNKMPSGERLASLDVCSGAGGLALGLQQAGFDPVLLLDKYDKACETLRANRPHWDVRQMNLVDFDPFEDQHVYDVDLLSAGLPRVKATASVRRSRDSEGELNLLKAAIMLVHGVQPRALLIENVPDLVTKEEYSSIREYVGKELDHLGYRYNWFVLNAADFGVAQDRKQGIMVAFKGESIDRFTPPEPAWGEPVTVGSALRDSMAARGWSQVDEWAAQASRLAPTLVGGSFAHGGADLGPTGTKRAWARMGVDGATVADTVPGSDFRWDPSLGREGMAKLTVAQVAILQGFPPDWTFAGGKTAGYRQAANASPPPVGRALGLAIRAALNTR